MSSPTLTGASPPPSSSTRSRFTYQHLKHLSQSHPNTNTSPLRVIAHIDLDAFYAQCEQLRLGLPASTPLAVQQWSGLIAVNYAAREFGITRFLNLEDAKKRCPDLVCQHVATWKPGDDRWRYREDEEVLRDGINNMKVSLDYYRAESKRIFRVTTESLPPAPIQRVEKAGIDEFFLDLSAQVHQILLQRFPDELATPPPYDDPTENLPQPPTTVLDWAADALVDLDPEHSEDQDPDWDDVATLIGSEIVRDVRKAVFDKLGYTCSGGIARNKMMAKLGSGHKKPNQQTVVRNRAIGHFLSGFKFTKIRNLGGKLGENVVATFGTENVTELLDIPIERMRAKMGFETGSWLYAIIRGEDHTEVNPRTQIKSMLSAKSFKTPITTVEEAERWLRIFAADIFLRCVDEGVLENRRRPKTMNLHHRQGWPSRSRQIPIPSGRPITEEGLFELAKTLLGQIVVDGKAWPCNNLSLSVGGFEEGLQGNKGIGGFLVRGEEAKAMVESNLREIGEHDDGEMASTRPTKRARTEATGPGISHFFNKREESYGSRGSREPSMSTDFKEASSDVIDASDFPSEHHDSPAPHQDLHQESILTYFCPDCQRQIPELDRDEHEDWHFAKNLQLEERQHQQQQQRQSETPSNPPSNAKAANSTHISRGRGGSAKSRGRGGGTANGKVVPEKGQKKLAFG